MHEVGLIQDALARAIDVALRVGAPRIEQVTFVIGDDGHLTANTVKDLFQALSAGTIAEGAEVAVETRPDERRCPACGTLNSAGNADPTCARCGALIPPFGSRREIVLESIAVPENCEVTGCA